MTVTIRGGHTNKKVSDKEIRLVYAWTAQKLVDKEIYRKLSTCIVFNKDMMEREGDYGGCEVKKVRKGVSPRKFTIYIDPRLSRLTQLRTFFHEMKHLEQYVRGDLEDIPGLVRWKRRFYDADENNYRDLPYEIEAVNAEKVLLREYLEFLDQYNISF